MKVLCVGDIHGRHELVTEAFDVFLKGKYDKIIFHGDIADSFDRSTEDILRCFNLVLGMKRTYPDQIVILVGNHDEQYFHQSPGDYICEGFSVGHHGVLFPLLSENRRLFRYAYGIQNYLFTHAGVNASWFIKNYDRIHHWASIMAIEITDLTQWWQIFDGISQTKDKQILFEVGPQRGGFKNHVGGPLWCDKSEMISHKPIVGLHQVVGHTSDHFIRRVTAFGDTKQIINNDTSVTFIDVLSYRHQFLTLNIE